METKGQRIRALREKRKMSQTELGKKLGNISASAVSSIELDKQSLTDKQLEVLSKEFNVSIDFIIKGSFDENSNNSATMKIGNESTNGIYESIKEIKNQFADQIVFLREQLTTKDRQIEFQNRMLEKLGKSESYMGDAAAGKERRGFQKAKNQILEPVKAFAKVA